jgi:putative membrane protein
MMGGMGSMMAGGYLWAVLVLLLLAVAATGAVIAVVLTLRHTTQTPSPNHGHAAAMEILRRRYATGEINEDEYQRRSATITAG